MIISETTRLVSINVISIDYLKLKRILSLLFKPLNVSTGYSYT